MSLLPTEPGISAAPDANHLPATELPPEALAMMADFFKALSETSRLQIAFCLQAGEKNVSQIIEITCLGQANVSKHLKNLTQAGVVSRSQRGNSVYYQIANPLVFPMCDLVRDFLLSQVSQQNQQLERLRTLQQSE
ncbi:putative transcriptional regulator [Rubidibacter lacunae KORDI 51-2]|uniref:Putative transcriptional regulator n=2 Tax=Rubidibacter TaxID=582491 RepID=U5DLI5_9CHRO|nr:putative transcriptional regulator [Rubidibacter lacunae KORDI 51-2]